MKKLFLFVTLVAALCLTGCGSLSDKEIKDNFIKDIESLKSYYMEGSLKLINNDDSYEYDVEVSYQKDDNYKVSLNNKGNNYEQIILKNKEGVYVITPSLNKSFKFQSDWPDNNSQSYLLGSVVNDLKKDNEYKFTQKDSDYIYTVKTNYPNNPKYTKQNIILDKNYKKDDIVTKKSPRSSYHSENITVDDVRKRAFSTLEDDLKNEILEDDYIVSKREEVEDDLDIFKDIEENPEEEVINTKKVDIVDNEDFDDDLLDDTEYLAKKLEEQKRKLDEINDIINDNSNTKTRTVDEYLYREQERELSEKEQVNEPDEEESTQDKNSEEETIEDETIEGEIVEEPKIIEEIDETEEQEESPKSLDEAYKDAFDDIEEASTKTEKKEKKEKDMSDSELLNLIDSMYEKSEDDE